MGLYSNNCPTQNKKWFSFPHARAKQKPKEQLKLKTPKTILKKPKEGEQIEINEVFKNYKKKSENENKKNIKTINNKN
jgi:hypothetical protein